MSDRGQTRVTRLAKAKGSCIARSHIFRLARNEDMVIVQKMDNRGRRGCPGLFYHDYSLVVLCGELETSSRRGERGRLHETTNDQSTDTKVVHTYSNNRLISRPMMLYQIYERFGVHTQDMQCVRIHLLHLLSSLFSQSATDLIYT